VEAKGEAKRNRLSSVSVDRLAINVFRATCHEKGERLIHYSDFIMLSFLPNLSVGTKAELFLQHDNVERCNFAVVFYLNRIFQITFLSAVVRIYSI
jgi:hypothetical protein